MPTSEARIAANQANARKSTGPRTPEGKAASRRNALKHGLTGSGIALRVEDAAEVDRIRRGFEDEFRPKSESGRTLVRRISLMAVRMDRCALQETASLSTRVLDAQMDFDEENPPIEGPFARVREELRDEVAGFALFDPSKEATLARKYEAASERCFFRCLKELRQMSRDDRSAEPAPPSGSLASFELQEEARAFEGEMRAVAEAIETNRALKAAALAENRPFDPASAVPIPRRSPLIPTSEVSFAVGKLR